LDEEPNEFDFWEHTEAAKKLNALYTNRIYVQPLGEGIVRINFGETMDAEPSYHTAIAATPEQAIEFASLIYRVANTMLERLAATQTAADMAPVEQTGQDDGNNAD